MSKTMLNPPSRWAGFSFQDWGSDDMNMDNGVPVPIPSSVLPDDKTTALGRCRR
jgi:hypothetical protein